MARWIVLARSKRAPLRLAMVRIGKTAINGAGDRALFFVVQPDTFAAALRVDRVRLPALADRLVRALRLADSAVDAPLGSGVAIASDRLALASNSRTGRGPRRGSNADLGRSGSNVDGGRRRAQNQAQRGAAVSDHPLFAFVPRGRAGSTQVGSGRTRSDAVGFSRIQSDSVGFGDSLELCASTCASIRCTGSILVQCRPLLYPSLLASRARPPPAPVPTRGRGSPIRSRKTPPAFHHRPFPTPEWKESPR